ncbi:MAG TPA: SUMF1/EgtB/PvdO family nonheme iron enzyme [Bryobacteraceae bacterium]|nr:SUMF1/EgtB/PvdO family nonheme iron enzyme [Bryobacteraceae bacterium]
MYATQSLTNDRRMLLSRLSEARAETDAIFRMVRPEAIYDRPIPERHRIVFYVGHLEAFDWNLLSSPCGLASFHPGFDRLFAFGIDPVGGGLPTDQPQDWPRLQEVNEYGNHVRRALDQVLDTAPAPDFGEGSFGQLLNVAIEHRLMHAETLAYMFHQMPFERKTGIKPRRVLQGPSFTPEDVRVPAGRATLGRRRDSAVFGWDNEFEVHSVDVPAFTIDRFKVTNGQFLEFMEDGGYNDRTLWADADWEWKAARQISHPVFWLRRGNRWIYRSMFDELPLPLEWPAYVSHAEASAYARWAGKVLPTEAQWHRAAYGTNGAGEREYPWGDEQPASWTQAPAPDAWDPAPVNACTLGASAFGVEGLLANGWEWTSTKFGPFPGFQSFACYPGYSAQFFDGKHYVMKGGSIRTASCMLRRTFRNWFQPHYQYVYAGFRCASA